VSVVDRVARVLERGLDDRALRHAVLAELRKTVPFDWYAWLLTDPETSVGTAPLAETPSLADLPTLIRLKYLTPTNRWTALTANTATTLVGATGGDRSTSRLWAELLAGYGVDDVASIVLRDQFGSWGFLDLWRADGTFTPGECEVLSAVARVVAPAQRLDLLPTFTASTSLAEPPAPAVLLMGADLRLLTQTPKTDAHLRALLPTDADRSPVPAGAFNVAAQLLAREDGVDANPPSARAHLGEGRWVTFRADRLLGATPDGAAIAVSIEPTSPAERTALYARVAGLSAREAELLHHLVAGGTTREVAGRMFVSEHTVQDHLKSIFAKTDAHDRRVLVARATGTR
jgi:DNA-binding CsgD family transcriptional regulator